MGKYSQKNNGNVHGGFIFPNSPERKWKLILQMLSHKLPCVWKHTSSWKEYINQAEKKSFISKKD